MTPFFHCCALCFPSFRLALPLFPLPYLFLLLSFSFFFPLPFGPNHECFFISMRGRFPQLAFPPPKPTWFLTITDPYGHLFERSTSPSSFPSLYWYLFSFFKQRDPFCLVATPPRHCFVSPSPSGSPHLAPRVPGGFLFGEFRPFYFGGGTFLPPSPFLFSRLALPGPCFLFLCQSFPPIFFKEEPHPPHQRPRLPASVFWIFGVFWEDGFYPDRFIRATSSPFSPVPPLFFFFLHCPFRCVCHLFLPF